MIPLDVAGLVTVAARATNVHPEAILESVDLDAIGSILADTGSETDPHAAAARLLAGIVQNHPFGGATDEVALLAAAQLLSLNGLDLHLEPHDAKRAIADIRSRSTDVRRLQAWVAERAIPSSQRRSGSMKKLAVAGLCAAFAASVALLSLDHISNGNPVAVPNFMAEKPEVAVYLQDTISPTDRNRLFHRIQGLDGVAQVTYESKEQTYERFKRIFANQPALSENVSPGALPALFRVRLRDSSKFAAVSAQLQGQPGIERIVDQRSLLNMSVQALRGRANESQTKMKELRDPCPRDGVTDRIYFLLNSKGYHQFQDRIYCYQTRSYHLPLHLPKPWKGRLRPVHR